MLYAYLSPFTSIFVWDQSSQPKLCFLFDKEGEWEGEVTPHIVHCIGGGIKNSDLKLPPSLN